MSCCTPFARYLVVAGILIVFPEQASAGSENGIRPLRVVTYNLLHDGPASGFVDGHTHLEHRLEMAIRELKTLDPDIIAVQEASDSRRHGNVPERLARLYVVFGPATDRLFGLKALDRLIVGLLGFKEGAAMLSRFPIVTSALYELPGCRDWIDRRILLQAQLATPWGPLQIYSTHTGRGDECQVERVGQIVRDGLGRGPSLLMAGFNMPETSAMLSSLRNHAGFVDGFRFANPDAPGPTVWQRIEAPIATVSRRVDFILLLNSRESRRPGPIQPSCARSPGTVS